MTTNYHITALIETEQDYAAVFEHDGVLSNQIVHLLGSVFAGGKPAIWPFALVEGEFVPLNLQPGYVGMTFYGRPMTDAKPKGK